HQKLRAQSLVYKRRKRTDATSLDRMVGVQQLRANSACVRNLTQKMHYLFDSWTEYLGIRIQKQNVPSRAVREPEVVGPGKSQVVIALDELYRREFVSDHLTAAIAGRIVNNDY